MLTCNAFHTIALLAHFSYSKRRHTTAAYTIIAWVWMVLILILLIIPVILYRSPYLSLCPDSRWIPASSGTLAALLLPSIWHTVALTATLFNSSTVFAISGFTIGYTAGSLLSSYTLLNGAA